jgi:lipopolysaccharide biosynthesis glycosyltransferase
MPLHLTFCHAGPGVSGLIVSVLSALTSCNAGPVNIHIHSDMDEFLFTRLQKTILKAFNQVEVFGYRLNLEPFSKLRLDYPPIFYYRLLLPLLHPQIDEIIYLDTDLIIERNLFQMQSIASGKCKIAAVRDPIESRKCIDLSSSPPYINSGVMYLDLAKLRNDGFTFKCLSWLNIHCGRNLHHHDQDAINVFLNGEDLLLLDASWNDMLPDPRSLDNPIDRIIHIPGPFKPWNICCPIRYREKFQRYLSQFRFEDTVELIHPTNEAQAVFAANQGRGVSDFSEALRWYEAALGFRWKDKSSDHAGFLSAIQQMRGYHSLGRLRIATEIGADAFEMVGFPKNAHSPFQYANILAS